MRTLILAIAFILTTGFTQAQTITKIAGGGFDPDGGPALNTDLYSLIELKYNQKNGDIYLSQTLTHRVRVIDASGNINILAGGNGAGYTGDGGPATSAKLIQPCGITTDDSGNVYFADAGNHVIRKVNRATGIITTVAGTGVSGFSGDGGPATAATFSQPEDVFWHKPSRAIYVCDVRNRRIRKISASGIINTIAGTGSFLSNGNGGPASSAAIAATSLVVNTIGQIYLGDNISYTIRKIDTNGIISHFAGDSGIVAYNGDNIMASVARLNPVRLELDNSEENLFVADWWNCRIRKINITTRIITTVAGNGATGAGGDGGPATAAQIWRPNGIGFDSCGNMFVSNVELPRVRKVAFNPTCLPSVDLPEVASIDIGGILNPFSDAISIDGIQEPVVYKLITLTGTSILEGNLERGSTKIVTEQLPSGLYILQLTTKNAGSVVRKLVKQ